MNEVFARATGSQDTTMLRPGAGMMKDETLIALRKVLGVALLRETSRQRYLAALDRTGIDLPHEVPPRR